ncbi:MAG TPA: hypothetical protein PK286_01505 [Devosia sp.]|nr:hypothetical protein [Devosia sp.]
MQQVEHECGTFLCGVARPPAKIGFDAQRVIIFAGQMPAVAVVGP